MKKSSILFILHLPPPIHGAGLMGKHIQESVLINDQFDADYLNLSSSSTIDEIGKSGIKKLGRIFRQLILVIQLLFRKKYDLCYMTLTASGPGFYKDLLTVCLLKLAGKKIVYHFHNKGVSEQKGLIKHLLYRFAFRKTNSILLSSLLYKDIAEYVKQENVFVCANGIPEELNTVTIRPVIENQPCQLLFLSNMMKEKGAEVLLDACNELKQMNASFQCHFVGPWGDITENGFKDKIKNLQLEQEIVLHGKKYGAEKAALLKAADIFVFPTYYHNECFPLVILEAMQYSLPVISTFEGAIPSLVDDNITGLLTEQKNSSQLAAKISVLLAHPTLRNQLGAAGYQQFKTKYTLTQFEHTLVAILNEIIQPTGRKDLTFIHQ